MRIRPLPCSLGIAILAGGLATTPAQAQLEPPTTASELLTALEQTTARTLITPLTNTPDHLEFEYAVGPFVYNIILGKPDAQYYAITVFPVNTDDVPRWAGCNGTMAYTGTDTRGMHVALDREARAWADELCRATPPIIGNAMYRRLRGNQP